MKTLTFRSKFAGRLDDKGELIKELNPAEKLNLMQLQSKKEQ